MQPELGEVLDFSFVSVRGSFIEYCTPQFIADMMLLVTA